MTIRSISFLCLTLVLAGCYGSHKPDLASDAKLNAIVENKTTASEVRNLLGDPVYVVSRRSGDVLWAYGGAQESLFSDIRFASVTLEIHNGVVLSKHVSRF